MSGLDRRRMLCLSMALLPVLASHKALAEPPAQASARAITPPPQPMVYTRRLERTLVGDARIVVERKFAIRFTRSDTGFVVDGEQIAVTVETPKELAALGEMERERVETGIFPLELDRSGRIRSGVGADEEPEVEEAIRYVSDAVAKLDRSEDERATMKEFVNAIHQAGTAIVSMLPPDLFAPVESDRTDMRTIALPVGGEGIVETRFTAQRDPSTGLMRRATREVVTSIAQDERRTTETFSLGS